MLISNLSGCSVDGTTAFAAAICTDFLASKPSNCFVDLAHSLLPSEQKSLDSFCPNV